MQAALEKRLRYRVLNFWHTDYVTLQNICWRKCQSSLQGIKEHQEGSFQRMPYVRRKKF